MLGRRVPYSEKMEEEKWGNSTLLSWERSYTVSFRIYDYEGYVNKEDETHKDMHSL